MIWLLLLLAWLGHAMWLMRLLNYAYACPLPKTLLKLYRLLTGVLILCFPLLWLLLDGLDGDIFTHMGLLSGMIYVFACAALAGLYLPFVTVQRLVTQSKRIASSTTNELIPLPYHLGDGKNRWLATLPYNQAFEMQLTGHTLPLKFLPKELQNLTVLVLSDLHFHGTPGRNSFDALFAYLAAMPTPDVVVLLGDYLDDDTHLHWLAPLLGQLKWNCTGVAILGNHDVHHQPETIRAELVRLGYTVLSGGWQRVTIRDVPVLFFGDERPWMNGPANLSQAPMAGFRIYCTHTPDNFPTAHASMCDLVLAGHVHGGGIRLPVFGSIFVPSKFGRKYDCGMFEWDRTVMVVGRGISGKEPIRLNCRPQVLRLTLVQG